MRRQMIKLRISIAYNWIKLYIIKKVIRGIWRFISSSLTSLIVIAALVFIIWIECNRSYTATYAILDYIGIAGLLFAIIIEFLKSEKNRKNNANKLNLLDWDINDFASNTLLKMELFFFNKIQPTCVCHIAEKVIIMDENKIKRKIRKNRFWSSQVNIYDFTRFDRTITKGELLESIVSELRERLNTCMSTYMSFAPKNEYRILRRLKYLIEAPGFCRITDYSTIDRSYLASELKSIIKALKDAKSVLDKQWNRDKPAVDNIISLKYKLKKLKKDKPLIIRNKLKKIRIRLRYKIQQDFADFLGIDEYDYDRMERGKQEIPQFTAIFIAQKLNMPIERIFTIRPANK